MKVSTESAPDSQIVLTIEVEPEELEKGLGESYRRVVQRAVVPGFRKGKAPRPMLERYYGRSVLLEDFVEKNAPKLANQAIAEQELDVISQPRLEVTDLDPVIFTATVDIRPTIDLGDYLEIRIEREDATVDEAQIDAQIERLRDSRGTWEVVERPAEVNDLVTIDLKADSEGETMLERDGLEYLMNAERNDPAPGFVEEIVGLSAGDSKTFDITMPDVDAENQDEEQQLLTPLAGKTLAFSVTVHEIKGRTLPELNDEFVEQVTSDKKSVAELRDMIRHNLEVEAEYNAVEKVKDEALEKLSEGATLETPFTLIENEIDNMLRDREEYLRSQGISFQDYMRIIGADFETIRESVRTDARARVRRSLALGKLVDLEQIDVEQNEVSDEIAESIRSAGQDSAAMARLLDQPQARDTISTRLKTRKALARLVEIATEGKVSYPFVHDHDHDAEATSEETQPNEQAASKAEATE